MLLIPQVKKLKTNVLALSWVSFFNDVSSEIIYPLLPIFLTSVLGAGVAFVGLIEGIAESTASILKLFSGWFSDKLQKRKLLAVWGYGISTTVRPLIALAISPLEVLLLRFADRVGKGVRTSARDALIAESVASEQYGIAYGFNRAMDHLGAVLGPLIATSILALFHENLRFLFLIGCLPGIIAVGILLIYVKEQKPQLQSLTTVKLSLKSLPPQFKLFLLATTLFTLGNSSDAFLLLKAKGAGITLAAIPILWMILNFVKSVTSFWGGYLSDRIGRKQTIILGWMIYALVYLGFGLAASAYHIWLLFILYGFYFGCTEGVEKALVADFIPSEKLATVFGIYHFLIGIAAFPASLIFGMIWQWLGSQWAFGFGSMLALIASGLMLAVKTPTKH